IPIIGTGGVVNGNDAMEMILAGATAVGVGSAVYYDGPKVFEKITDEMTKIMQENGWTKISELIGAANK
ncbi:MAG: dihydroorotate dehydrogenase, partial [Nanoarchaeota archaeon]|nr:dihydroorotate dehydrogenase [Nanoarchaeota archaeon]